MKERILIVDDYLMIRQVFEQAIASSEKYKLAGSLSSAALAVEFCEKNPVDLVLMDVLIPGGMSGLEAAKRIKQISPRTKICIVTSMPETAYISQAKEIGVESFWHKEIQEQPILEIIERTLTGESVYPDSRPTVQLGEADSGEFTERELSILRLLVSGLSNKEIADTLGLAEKTVKNNISVLLQKTGFRTRLELAVRARDIGLVIGE